MRKSQKNGFTIIELLLTVAAMAILAGFSFSMYRSLQGGNDLTNIQNIFVQTMRRAQILAQANEGDSDWGVSLQNGSLILFEGSSYATRTAGKDEIFDIPASITYSGVTEIVFEKFSGQPLFTGITTFISPYGESRSVTLNENGMLEY